MLLLLLLVLLSTCKGRRMERRSPMHYRMLLKRSIHVYHPRWWWPWRPWKLMSRRPRPELRSTIPSWPKHFKSKFLCNCPNIAIFRVSKSAHSLPMHLPCLDNLFIRLESNNLSLLTLSPFNYSLSPIILQRQPAPVRNHRITSIILQRQPAPYPKQISVLSVWQAFTTDIPELRFICSSGPKTLEIGRAHV